MQGTQLFEGSVLWDAGTNSARFGNGRNGPLDATAAGIVEGVTVRLRRR